MRNCAKKTKKPKQKKNEIIGTVGIHYIDWDNQIGYIGYWLSENMQSHGIISQCVSYLIKFAFEKLELQHIDITAAFDNRKSRAIPERLGFKYLKNCKDQCCDNRNKNKNNCCNQTETQNKNQCQKYTLLPFQYFWNTYFFHCYLYF